MNQFWVWCVEGTETWVEARCASREAAEDFAAYLRKKVPGRETYITEADDEA